MADDSMKVVIATLADRFRRFPTEEEVKNFIFGDEETRNAIWNKEVANNAG